MKKKTIIEKYKKNINKKYFRYNNNDKKKIFRYNKFNEFFNNFHFSSITIVGAGHIGVPLSVFLLEKLIL